MKIKVLGCSGAIAEGCRTTSFLIDDDVLIDAGTGVGDLTIEQMSAVQHVFLTHSHLDHVAALPLMIDACAMQRRRPLLVHALGPTIAALKAHVFNDVIWPDFSRIPSAHAPLLMFRELVVGMRIAIGASRYIEALSAVHTVPAVGYAVCLENRGCWAFSGDTERNPAFWRRLNRLPVRALVIETAFSDQERELARISQHLSPASLAQELALIEPGRDYPVFITHTKPAQSETIMDEIGHTIPAPLFAPHDEPLPDEDDTPRRDVRWLRRGQEFRF